MAINWSNFLQGLFMCVGFCVLAWLWGYFRQAGEHAHKSRNPETVGIKLSTIDVIIKDGPTCQ